MYGQLGNLNNASLNDGSLNVAGCADLAFQQRLARDALAKKKAYAAQSDAAAAGAPLGTVFDIAANEVSDICDLAFGACERLKQINDRLFGPQPEAAAPGVAGRPAGSKVEYLGEKLALAKHQVAQVHSAINALERL